ncbi:MAG: hypothetical protein HYR51_14745 [Candidatus Rokubacteria bacterium]|nr:hypothetical protein [Candidatus Rokubacteria bacterium]
MAPRSAARPRDREGGQGAITFHSEARLTGTDRGVVLFRRTLRAQIDAVREGRDPIGVGFDPAAAVVRVEAGNYLVEPSPPSTSRTAGIA